MVIDNYLRRVGKGYCETWLGNLIIREEKLVPLVCIQLVSPDGEKGGKDLLSGGRSYHVSRPQFDNLLIRE